MTDPGSAPGGLPLPVFRILLDRSQDPVFVADEEGRFVYANPAASDLVEHSLDEILAMRVWDIDSNVLRENWSSRNSRLAEEGQRRTRSRLVTRNGDRVEVELTLTSLVFKDVRYLVAFARDLRARKAAEREILKTRERYQRLSESTFEGILISESGRVVDANRALARMLGTSVPDLIGRNVMDFVAPESRNRVARRMREGFEGPYKHLARRQDGTTFPVEVQGRSLSGGKGTMRVTAVRDLSEKKRMESEQLRTEEALLQSEALFRSIVEDQTEFIVRWKPDGTRTFVNESYCRYFGCTREEAIGTSFYPLIKEEERERVRRRIARITPENPVSSGEHRVILPNGEIGWNWWGDRGFFDKDGNLVELQSVGRDITELKQADLDAEIQRQRLLDADKMIILGTLVSGVAHEINNPNQFTMLSVPILQKIWKDLRPILDRHAQTHPALQPASLPYREMAGEVTRILEEILRGSRRIASIVSQLRDYALQPPTDAKTSVDVNHVIASAVALLANPIQKATARFSVSYGKSLPFIVCNEIRLEQVVVNLVLNACQALNDRTQAIRVESWYEPDADQVVLSVSDEGVGISRKDMARLTDPFFTTKREHGGTGLGLAVSARILEAMGADLRFASEPGKGTTVSMAIPVRHPEAVPVS